MKGKGEDRRIANRGQSRGYQSVPMASISTVASAAAGGAKKRLGAPKSTPDACLACGEPKIEHTAVELAHGCKRTPSDTRQRSGSRRAA